jgi:hypothetical protein
MTSVGIVRDLVVLAADKNAEYAIRGLLSRHQSLGIRQLLADIYVHPERDPGCLLKSDAFLSGFQQSHTHALVIFDREGCGREHNSRVELEQAVEGAIAQRGWIPSRIACVVLDPELEIWVWSDSIEVDNQLGWQGRNPDLRTWLRDNQLLIGSGNKPDRPKESMEVALRETRRPRSSAIFRRLAETVSLHRCVDDAFTKFKATLLNWFPAA